MYVSTPHSTNRTVMELSFVISIFLAFVFEEVPTIGKLSRTAQREPSEVSNLINPCTYGTFWCEYIKTLTKEKSQKLSLNCCSKHAMFLDESLCKSLADTEPQCLLHLLVKLLLHGMMKIVL